MTPEEEAEAAAERRRIIRRAEMYTRALLATTLVVALGGAALIALLVRVPGVSYVKRWLVLSAIVLLPSAIGYLIQRYRESRARRERDSGE